MNNIEERIKSIRDKQKRHLNDIRGRLEDTLLEDNKITEIYESYQSSKSAGGTIRDLWIKSLRDELNKINSGEIKVSDLPAYNVSVTKPEFFGIRTTDSQLQVELLSYGRASVDFIKGSIW